MTEMRYLLNRIRIAFGRGPLVRSPADFHQLFTPGGVGHAPADLPDRYGWAREELVHLRLQNADLEDAIHEAVMAFEYAREARNGDDPARASDYVTRAELACRRVARLADLAGPVSH